MGNVFSVPIFIITLRETIEAAIIVSVLLGLVESLVTEKTGNAAADDAVNGMDEIEKKRIIKRMRWMIWGGALTGLFIALCIGAAFIAVFFTTLNDLWSKSEELWEGSFSLVACIIIMMMALTMLRIDRSKIKWRTKLAGAFDNKVEIKSKKDQREAKSSKWTLFLLPLITVLREGLEAVVFVGGVSLGQSAKSIPLAGICGVLVGFVVGYLIYASGSRVNLSIFLVISTQVLLLLGAGLFSKAVDDFEVYMFIHGVGGDVAETGSGPGSFDTSTSVWHLPYGSPENKTSTDGWSIFNAILGWTNNATYGSILSYCFYWLVAMLALFYMKWSEGRTSFFGVQSAAGKRRAARRETLGKVDSYDDKSKEVETPIDEDRQFASHV